MDTKMAKYNSRRLDFVLDGLYVVHCSDAAHLPGHHRLSGTLRNTNTVDQFKTCNKSEIVQSAGRKVLLS